MANAFEEFVKKPAATATKTPPKKITIPNYPVPVFDPNLKISAPTGKEIPATSKEGQKIMKKQVIQEAMPQGGNTALQDLGKAIVRAPFRAAQSTYLDYQKGFGGSDTTVPTTPFEKFIFGEEPVKANTTQFAETKKQIEPTYGKAAGPISAVAVFGGTLLDLTPFGGTEKNLAKGLLKETTEEGAKILLRKTGIADDLVETYAKTFAKAKTAKEVDTALTALKKVAETSKPVVREGIEQISKKAPEVVTPKLKTTVTNDVATEAIKYAEKNPDSFLVGKEFRNPVTKEMEGGPRLFQRIGESIRTGEISIDQLPKLAQDYGLNKEQVAKLFEDAATYSGRTLQALSRVEKELRALLPDIEIIKRDPTLWEKFKSTYLAVDNVRRSLLVTQLSTAARNAVSQAGRYTIGTVTDALNGAISKVTGKGEGFTPFLEDIAAVIRKFKPGNAEKLQEIMNKYPLENSRLYGTPVGDVGLTNKVTNALNSFNRGQEYFYRNLITDAKLSAAAKFKGVPIDQLPVEDFKKAIDEALEWTFSKTPGQGSFGNAVMNMYRAMPPLTLVNPFPRFATNALKFVYEYSPAGLMSLFGPKTRAAIAAGDFNAISKAMIGTTMLATGAMIRSNPNLAGEKWYEIKVGDKVIDARPYFPFSAYLFLGEIAVNGGDKLKGADWAQMSIGINRLAGTGLAIFDLLDNKMDADGAKDVINGIVSQWVGGFTVPFKTISDVVGQFRLEERTIKETKDIPVIGGALGNIPGLQELLPTKYSMFEDKPLEREQPLLRQTTGVSVTTKPYIQKELDRMGKDVADLVPKTGNLDANRIIIKQTGVILDRFNDKFEMSEGYKKLPDDQKLELLQELISEAKKEAKGQVAQELAAIVYNELKKVKGEARQKAIKELHNKGLMTENILEYLSPMLDAEPLPK